MICVGVREPASVHMDTHAVVTVSDGGFERGYAAGYEQGSAEGYDKGHADGKAEGYSAGYDKGNTDGYAKGHTAGLAERQHEVWTITLVDETVVEKEVALL